MRAKITLFMLLFLLASCSRGFDRGLMRMQVSSTEKMEISDGAQTLKEILALKPQLPENARLAVHFQNESFWELDASLKDKVLSELRAALTSGPFKEVVAITDYEAPQAGSSIWKGREESTLKTGPMIDSRLAAARYNADAILVIRPTIAEDRYPNPLLAFDIFTLSLTGLFLPAHQIDVLALVNMSVWDVRNGYLYASAESEAEDSSTVPLYWSADQERKTKAIAARKVIEKVMVEIKNRIK